VSTFTFEANRLLVVRVSRAQGRPYRGKSRVIESSPTTPGPVSSEAHRTKSVKGTTPNCGLTPTRVSGRSASDVRVWRRRPPISMLVLHSSLQLRVQPTVRLCWSLVVLPVLMFTVCGLAGSFTGNGPPNASEKSVSLPCRASVARSSGESR
jgi:hypothetical protein